MLKEDSGVFSIKEGPKEGPRVKVDRFLLGRNDYLEFTLPVGEDGRESRRETCSFGREWTRMLGGTGVGCRTPRVCPGSRKKGRDLRLRVYKSIRFLGEPRGTFEGSF